MMFFNELSPKQVVYLHCELRCLGYIYPYNQVQERRDDIIMLKEEHDEIGLLNHGDVSKEK